MQKRKANESEPGLLSHPLSWPEALTPNTPVCVLGHSGVTLQESVDARGRSWLGNCFKHKSGGGGGVGFLMPE